MLCPGGSLEVEAWTQSSRSDAFCPSGGLEAEAWTQDGRSDFAISCLVQNMGVWAVQNGESLGPGTQGT